MQPEAAEAQADGWVATYRDCSREILKSRSLRITGTCRDAASASPKSECSPRTEAPAPTCLTTRRLGRSHLAVESRRGAPVERWRGHGFRRPAPSHRCLALHFDYVSSPRSSNRACGFPALGSRSRSCARTRENRAVRPVRRSRPLCGLPPGKRTSSRTPPRASDPASDAAAVPPAPVPPAPPSGGRALASLSHATPSGISEPKTGLVGLRQSPRSLPPFRVPLEPRPLPSVGITRLPRYYGPLRHPAGPNWPSRVLGWRVRAIDRASRVASTPLRVHAVASTPAETTGHFRSRPNWRYRSLAAFPVTPAGRPPH